MALGDTHHHTILFTGFGEGTIAVLGRCPWLESSGVWVFDGVGDV